MEAGSESEDSTIQIVTIRGPIRSLNDISSIRKIKEPKAASIAIEQYILEKFEDGTFYSCNRCEKRYASKNHFRRHFSIKHLGIKNFPCSICGKRFHSRQPLRIHERTHTGEKPCLCEECGKSFSDPSSLRIHLLGHALPKDWQCDICGRYLSSEVSYNLHKRRHVRLGHSKSMFRYTCSDCGRSYRYKIHLRSHQSKHNNVKTFTCGICSEMFSKYQTLVKHRKMHTGEKSHACKVCGKTYNLLQDLRAHSTTHRKPAKKPGYRCSECGKEYYFWKTLNFHRCLGTYRCRICNVKFESVKEFKEHQRLYCLSKSHNYACSTCGKTFSKSSGLRNHKCKVVVFIDFDDEIPSDGWLNQNDSTAIKEEVDMVEKNESDSRNQMQFASAFDSARLESTKSRKKIGSKKAIKSNHVQNGFLQQSIPLQCTQEFPNLSDMQPRCILNTKCQLCEFDLNTPEAGEFNTPWFHVCPKAVKLKKDRSGKFIPLKDTLALKSRRKRKSHYKKNIA